MVANSHVVKTRMTFYSSVRPSSVKLRVMIDSAATIAALAVVANLKMTDAGVYS
jgi:hypothetical protein